MSKILVIDDDRELRCGVRAALTAHRHHVIEAATPEDGVQAASEDLPDLVLCDYALGHGSGLDVLAQLRQNPATVSVPLILITASNDTTVMRRSMDLGADDFLHKPFTGDELLAAVKARLNRQEAIKAHAAATLHEIEARHRLLFESSADAVMVLTPPTWKFVEANPAALRMFGASSKAAFVDVNLGDLCPERQPDGALTAPQAKAMIEAALRNGSHHFEWTHQRFNGEVFPATVLLTRMEMGGQTVLQAAVHDLTEQRRAEAALRESERRYQMLAETSPAGVFHTDATGLTTYVNRRWCELAGLTAEEALGEGWLRAVHPEDRAALVRGWQEARTHAAVARADYRFLRPDGSVVWILGQAVPERDAAGQLVGYLGTVTDITERKHAEDALRKSEELLQEVGAIAQIGGWEMDMVTRQAKWTRTTYDLLGIQPGDPIPGPDEHVACYVAEDQPKVAEAIRKNIEDGEPLDFEARIEIPGKGLRWVRAVGRATRREGRCERVYGTIQDITDWKQAEAARRESEALFRAIATTAPDAFLMLDPEGRVNFWNPAAERIFGFTASEALSKDALQLIAPPELRAAYEDALRDFRSAGPGPVPDRILDVQAMRKDQSPFAAELSLSAVDLHGRRHTVAIVRDVTRQKETTQQLLQERILLRTLVDALPDCIYAKDREARKTLANQADVRNLGATTEEEVLGKTDYELLDRKAAAACYADDMRVILHGEAVIERQELVVNAKGGASWLETTKLPLRDGLGNIIGLVGIGHDITERRRAEEQLRKLSKAVEQSPASVVITDTTGRIEYVNPKFCAVTGYTPEEVLGQNPRVLKSGETPAAEYANLWRRITEGQEWRGEFHNRKKNGELYWEFAVISPIKDDVGNITHFLAVKEDITERKRTESERNLMEIHLRQAQKLESIGQLAAGIAHEINTPMQYIGDNTRFLQDAFGELRRVVGTFQDLTKRLHDQPGLAEVLSPVETVLQAADVDYLVEEIPKAIEQSLQGAERVTKIVRAMKEFSHPGTEQKTAVDLNHAIESTITVARNEWKYVAELETCFDPQLPPVPCLPGEFNQVILNLIINAAHAIADVVGKNSGCKGRITIATRQQGNWAEIRVADTGTGVPEAVRGRIFDPFFTTKPVGKGTGQGLAIARSVIVDKHGGSLTFETEMGRGTTFIIRLPLTAGETARPLPPS